MPVNPPHISVLRSQTREHTESRVVTSEQKVSRRALVKEVIRVLPQVRVAIKQIQGTATTPMAPIPTAPIASSTQATQTSEKL